MAEALKDQFGPAVVHRMAAELSVVYRGFDRKTFEKSALTGFDDMELMDRGRHLGRVLHRSLPTDFSSAVDILLATLPASRNGEGGMASFFYLGHTEFVKSFGLPWFEDSMRALHALTQHFTGEFAIRPFLEHHGEQTLARLREWTADRNEHVRRLVSEGSRPRLPWAPRLRAFQRDPAPVLDLLERLKDDPSLYVRRSVANNLNDIGKDHPAVLIDTTKRWMVDASDDRRWIVQHALRSAVKSGDAGALAVLGFGDRVRLDVAAATFTPKRPVIGTKVVIVVELVNPTHRRQQAVVDLAVHFRKSNRSTNAKVFKLASVALAAGDRVMLRKTISLADLSTRRHYPGEHPVDVQINGSRHPIGQFVITAPRSARQGRQREE